MKKIVAFSFSCLLVFCQCSKEEEGQVDTAKELKIVMGIQCGWGLRNDSLSIEASQVRLVQYFRNDPFTSYTAIDSVSQISAQQLKDLNSALDWNYFKSLNYNSGGLGYDGCDIWLKISKDGAQHEIRFDVLDTIPQLRQFSNQLDSLWSSMGYFPKDMLDNF